MSAGLLHTEQYDPRVGMSHEAKLMRIVARETPVLESMCFFPPTLFSPHLESVHRLLIRFIRTD